MYKVIKRNGDTVDFTLVKIQNAIEKAMKACGRQYDSDILTTLALKSASMAEHASQDGAVAVESIQDCVEQVLSESGYFDVARSYILYRDQHKKIREARNTLLDYQKTIDDYLKALDWRVKESSTVTYSLGGLILSNSGAITANYWLTQVYDDEIAEAHRNVQLHLHDLSMLSPYCAGWNLKDLIERGIISVAGRTASKPAAHLSTLANQMVNFLGILQNEWAGAQAFSSFDTYLAPFVKADHLTYEDVKQAIQSFVFGVNTPSRWGTQAPFTNITLDWTVPDDLKDLPAIVGGKEMPFTYGDCKAEMDVVNKAFIEVMLEGDANGRGHQYPIPTYSITKDFDWSDTENNRLLFNMAAKYGIPYFSNYVNSDMNPSDIRSMCPLRGDQKVLVNGGWSSGWRILPVRSLYDESSGDTVYEVLYNGTSHQARIREFDGLSFLKLTMANGHEAVVSTNHLNRVMRVAADGIDTVTDLPTDRLAEGDYLPFAARAYEGKGLADVDGYVAALFAVFGRTDEDESLVFDFDSATQLATADSLADLAIHYYGSDDVSVIELDGVTTRVRVRSAVLSGLLDETIVATASGKRTVSAAVIGRSAEFRTDLLNTMMAFSCDGDCPGNPLDVEATAEVLCAVAASLGCQTLHSGKAADGAEDGMIVKDGYAWSRIVSIEPAGEGTGYCFEVVDGDPYFMLPNGLVTHNCRLRLELNELRRKNGGFFGSGDSTGSIGVVTINLPQIAYLSAGKDDFFARLDSMMDIAARSLDIKRRTLNRYLEAGLYPYTKAYLGHFNNHFSTIGLVGMNEACLNARWLRKDMTCPESHAFAIEVLNHMRARLIKYQNMYGALFNLEATPAESTAFRFAKHDKQKYPNIITANENGTPYYTNSTNLPVGATDDIFAALDDQDDLQVLYTSGTVFHTFLGEKMPDWKSTMTLVRRIAENYKLPYYTLSPTYSVCRTHGYLAGEHHTCPYCGERTEIYSRITGYYRAVQNWNDGKAQEFKDRKTYDIGIASAGRGAGSDDPGVILHESDGRCGPDGCSFGPVPDDCGPDGCSFDPEPGGCGPDGCSFGFEDGSSIEPEHADHCGPDGCSFDDEPMADEEILPDSYPVPENLTGNTFVLRTRTCSKCRTLDKMLASRDMELPSIYAEDYMDWVRAIGATESPTLIQDGVPTAHGLSDTLKALGLD